MIVPPQRIVVITGAGSEHGVGSAPARLLGAGGMRAVLTSTTDRIFYRVDELRASGVEAEGVAADLRRRSGVEAVVARTESAHGSADVLINASGMTSISGLTGAVETAAIGVTVDAVAPGRIDPASASDHERAMSAATSVGPIRHPGRRARSLSPIGGLLAATRCAAVRSASTEPSPPES